MNQAVSFTQSIASCIRYKIDKVFLFCFFFCPTGGYISAGKGRKIIYSDTMKLKTMFYIRFFELGKKETKNPGESGRWSEGQSSRSCLSNDTSQGINHGENICGGILFVL